MTVKPSFCYLIRMKGVNCILLAPTKQSTNFAGKPINQSAIARAINIDQSYLSRILAGKQDPSMKMARKIAEALNMPVMKFLALLESNRTRVA